MKAHIKTTEPPDLSGYSEEDLAKTDLYKGCLDYYAKPIILKNLKIGKNQYGQLVIDFESVNHKYLDVHKGGWTSARCEDDYEENPYVTTIIRIETQEEYFDKDLDFTCKIANVELHLEPESKEEDEMLHGILAVMPLKWQYSLLIAQHKDFDTPDDDRPDSEDSYEGEELSDDYIYFDFKL